uniref:Uncharacterized protein n=1 Tax=Arundo donax TaxID=35708 RepID=A0A0A9H520_ARUDO
MRWRYDGKLHGDVPDSGWATLDPQRGSRVDAANPMPDSSAMILRSLSIWSAVQIDIWVLTKIFVAARVLVCLPLLRWPLTLP